MYSDDINETTMVIISQCMQIANDVKTNMSKYRNSYVNYTSIFKKVKRKYT